MRRFGLLGQIAEWSTRRYLIAFAVALASATVIGGVSALFANPVFTRMTPATWWSYPIWAISAILTGLTVATFTRERELGVPGQPRVMAGGFLSVLAVGCPICNKLVVAAVGISGALDYWAPLQPFIGIASIGLLLAALLRRLSGGACRVPVSSV